MVAARGSTVRDPPDILPAIHQAVPIPAAVVTNFVLVYFLGLCPVIGVTNKSATGFRLGLATTFVMVLASIAAWAMNFVLVRAPYLRIIAFIVAIASIVQLVELFIKKFSPSLYRELGIFLPLIASNSQVLLLAIFQTNRGYTLTQGLAFAVGGGGSASPPCWPSLVSCASGWSSRRSRRSRAARRSCS